MKPRTGLFAVSRNLDSLAAAVIGFVIIQFYCNYSGIGVSPDSVNYLSTARHLARGHGFVAFDGKPLIDFPLGYPLFLAAVSFLVQLDPLSWMPVVNGFLFALLIYSCGAVMNGFRPFSRWYKWVVLSCLAISPTLLEIYSMMWSETLFILGTIFFVVCFRRHSLTGDRRWIWIAATLTAILCVTRYAGIMLIGTGGLLILVERDRPWKKKIADELIFGLVSASLLALNLWRNLRLTGLATGARQKSITPFFTNLQYFGNVLGDWLLFRSNEILHVVLTVSAFLLFAGVMIWLYFRDRRFSFEFIISAVGLVYCVFMIYSATVSRYERFTNRLLSPAYIPFLWATSFWIPAFVRRYSGLVKGLLIGAIALLVFGFQANQWGVDNENYEGIHDAGIPGYTEDPFPQSDVVRYLNAHKTAFLPGWHIYSNAGDAVYFFSGMTADHLPQRVFPDQVARYYAEPRSYLVWFNDVDNPDLLDLKTVLRNKKMRPVASFDDGSVYAGEDSVAGNR